MQGRIALRPPPRAAKPFSVNGPLAPGQGREIFKETDTTKKAEDELAANVRFLGYHWDLAASDSCGYGEAVVALLSHQSGEVVKSALEALGNLGHAGARYADVVAEALWSPDHEIVCAAAVALGRIGPSASGVRRHGARLEELSRQTTGLSETAVRTRVCVVQALGRLGAPEAADVACRLLKNDPAPEVQAVSCLALARLGGQAAKDMSGVIASKLDEGSTSIRSAATRALGHIGAEVLAAHSSAIVRKVLCADDMKSRGEAVTALSKLKNTQAAEPVVKELIPLLEAEKPATRAAAALALGGLGSEVAGRAEERLVAMLADTGEDESWIPNQVGGGAPRDPIAMRRPRCAAASALGAAQAEQHVKAVCDLLDESSWEVRFCALEALANYGPLAKNAAASRVAGKLEDEAYPVRAKACVALAAMKAYDEVDRIVELMSDKAQAVRTEAVAALGAMGDAAVEYTAEIAKLLNDVSNNVRGAAVKALGSLGDACRPYAGLIAGLLRDQQSDVRVEACNALIELGAHGAAFAEDVSALLSDPDPKVGAAAARALGEMGDEAVPFLAELQQMVDNERHPSDPRHDAARAALDKLPANVSSKALPPPPVEKVEQAVVVERGTDHME